MLCPSFYLNTMLTNRYIEIKRIFHWFKSSMKPATKEVNAEGVPFRVFLIFPEVLLHCQSRALAEDALYTITVLNFWTTRKSKL